MCKAKMPKLAWSFGFQSYTQTSSKNFVIELGQVEFLSLVENQNSTAVFSVVGIPFCFTQTLLVGEKQGEMMVVAQQREEKDDFVVCVVVLVVTIW